MKSKLIGIVIAAALAFALPANAQQGAFPNYPIVGGAAYCSSSVNSVCVQTVPAGPTGLTGNEQFPANTELANGRTPQNVLVTPASLGALPISLMAVTIVNPTAISASNVLGGVIYSATATITAANITLPVAPIDGQQFLISSNRTITALSVSGGGTASLMAANSSPTVLTASTTGPQGYVFRFNLGDTTWYRIQ